MAMLVTVVRRLHNLAYHSMALYSSMYGCWTVPDGTVLDREVKYFLPFVLLINCGKGGLWPTTNGQQGNQSVVECLVPNYYRTLIFSYKILTPAGHRE